MIPDGVLWLLPFEALQTIPNHYLLEDFSISYAQSISECLSNAKAENSKKSRQAHVAPLLILGDPIPSKAVSERLQASQLHGVLDEDTNSTTEVPALLKLYGPNLATVFTGNQASKDRLKRAMNQQSWLHLAVPGMVDDLNPLYSTLYLSPSIPEETDDGQFDARELLDLDWDCDLAILSGSQQPQERTRTGEGLVALSWAFNVAGCRAIVASRWKATPESKTQLMKELHRRLRLGQSRTGARIPASECLRQAALTMIRSPQFNHPHYWSNAMVLGSW